tara:strand:+ start:4206 stop:4865 length:660 start_codon:yes stop_codon:yes gene_type:complete
MMKNKVWPIAICLVGGLTVTSAACAQDVVKRSHTFNVSSETTLNIEAAVGTVEFVKGDINSHVVEVELVIEASEDSFFYGGGDINRVHLEADQHGDELELSIEPDDEEVEVTWRVTLPKMRSIDADLGVGEMSGDVYTTNATFEVGVGEIDLMFHGSDVDKVKAEAGIGDTRIRGSVRGDSHSERVLMTSESELAGSGEYRVKAEVGVGDITLDFKELN